MACAAQYMGDGRWYRGIVVSCSSTSEVEVFFVDYGNKELVSKQKVFKIFSCNDREF